MDRRASFDLDALRVLVAVIDHRGFTRAAVALDRTQSAVSMQMRRLEEAQGLALLERRPGGVVPTRAGEALAGYARRMLALNDEARAALADDLTTGEVRLGAMEDYARVLLPPLIARFGARHPGIAIEVETGLTGTLLPKLGRRFDLVIVMHAPGERGGELLRREPALWAVAPGQVALARDPLPLALAPQGCLFRDWALAGLGAQGRRWRLAYVSPSSASVEAAAAAGLALTVVKAGTFPDTLARVPARAGLPKLPVAEIRLHRAAPRSPAATAFADYLAQELTEGKTVTPPARTRHRH
jgi:DNA-binding transcriptional LysR family regulator